MAGIAPGRRSQRIRVALADGRPDVRYAVLPDGHRPVGKVAAQFEVAAVAVTDRPGAPAPYDPQHLVEAMRSAGWRGQ